MGDCQLLRWSLDQGPEHDPGSRHLCMVPGSWASLVAFLRTFRSLRCLRAQSVYSLLALVYDPDGDASENCRGGSRFEVVRLRVGDHIDAEQVTRPKWSGAAYEAGVRLP